MNRDSVNEYILWLERFREIYSRYLNPDSKDFNEELQEIFASTLLKFQRILSGNNTTSIEEDIIRLLKELVKKFSIVYDSNNSWNKSMQGPRNTNAFKQNIYISEITKLKEWLIDNINDPKFENNFEKIVMFVAKKRQMIEFLKLGFNKSPANNKYDVYFDIFGKKRVLNDNMRSPLFGSHAHHLFDESIKKPVTIIQHKYIYFEKEIPLTLYVGIHNGRPLWNHTKTEHHPELFQIMNELYSIFLSLVNISNKSSKRDKLVELYWLYMQTCPFERGSAAIGEILFSVLLIKYFGCDFFISNGWNGNPEIIPDIHALHYELDHFKSIFWDQFTNCTGKPNPNINNATAIRLKRNVIGP
jgi:hypothetical protein